MVTVAASLSKSLRTWARCVGSVRVTRSISDELLLKRALPTDSLDRRYTQVSLGVSEAGLEWLQAPTGSAVFGAAP